MRRALAIGLAAVALASSAVPDSAAAKAFKVVRTGVFALRTDMLMVALAKELCTCRMVSRVGEGRPELEAIEICLDRAQLPITPGLVFALTGIEIDDTVHEIEVGPTLLGAIASLFSGDAALARYDPRAHQYGCAFVPKR